MNIYVFIYQLIILQYYLLQMLWYILYYIIYFWCYFPISISIYYIHLFLLNISLVILCIHIYLFIYLFEGNLYGRLDRCFLRLHSINNNYNNNNNTVNNNPNNTQPTVCYNLVETKLVGTQALPGVSFEKNYRGRIVTKPVYPSDHYGLLIHLTTTTSATSAATVEWVYDT